MRKDAQFEISDRIQVFYQASPLISRAIQSKQHLITDEVLAVSLEQGMKPNEYQKNWEVDQESVEIGIRRFH
jgi:isoleucyl-tRNA synthetase